MKKIKEFFSKIGTDKRMHFICCFAITALVANFVNIGLALFAGVFAAFLKDVVWDATFHKGTFEFKDIIFGAAGSLVAFLLLLFKLLM